MSELLILKLKPRDYNDLYTIINGTIGKLCIENKLTEANLVMYMSKYTKKKIRSFLNPLLYHDDKMNTLFGVIVSIKDIDNDEIHFVSYDNTEDIKNTLHFINSYYGIFSGGYTKEYSFLPDRYIINKDAAILFYGNNKVIVKRNKSDRIDPIKAFLWAYFLHNSGMSRTKANKYLKKVYDKYKEEA